jgi:hypothetical protein
MAGIGDKAALEKEAADVKARDAAMMDTGAGMAGNVMGNIGMALLPGGVLKAASKVLPMIPGLASAGTALLAPKTLGGAAALGAATGVVQPATSNEDRVTNAVIGGIGGSAGNLAAQGIGRVLSPKTDAAVTALLNQGVRLTPGQIMGGATKRVEDSLTSVLGVGNLIRNRQTDALDDFNKAAINRALAPIGKRAIGTGREAVKQAGDDISAAYNSVLPKVTMNVTKGQELTNALASANNIVGSLPKDQADLFAKAISDNIMNKATPQGWLRGASFKQADSELGRLAAGYSSNADFASRELGRALREAQGGLRNLMQVQNPQYAPQIKAANEAWSNLVRIEDAAGRVGAKEGVFTPAQLAGAVKGNDKTLRDRAFARGEALMGDLSDTGLKVLPRSVPDSGTPERLVISNLLASLGGGSATLAGAGPQAIAAGAIGAGIYTQPAQKVIRALLTQRPDLARKLGNAFVAGAPYGAIPGAAIANSQE